MTTTQAPASPPTRSHDEAIAHARKISNAKKRPYDKGMCKQAVREQYGVPSDGAEDAAEAWSRTDHRVTRNEARRGMLAWWTGGSQGHGHVAIVLDKGAKTVLSTDWRRPGRFDNANTNELTTQWGLTLVGFSLDIDGVIVWHPQFPRADETFALAAEALAISKSPKRRAKWRRIQRLAEQLGGAQ